MGCGASKVEQVEPPPPRNSLEHGPPPRAESYEPQERRGSFRNIENTYTSGVSNAKSVDERFRGVEVGMALLCRDTFTSKYTKEVMSKWRPAIVRVYDGSNKTTKLCIHFDGWSEKFDRWIDLSEWEQGLEIAPLGLLSPDQIDVGDALTSRQNQATYHFLCTGDFTEIHAAGGEGVPEQGGDDESYFASAVEGDASPSLNARSTSSSPSARASAKYSVGMTVDVQDVISRKNQGKLSFQWRQAQVQEVAGSKIRVGYVGLGSAYDEVLDLLTEAERVRDGGTMTAMMRGTQHRHGHGAVGGVDKALGRARTETSVPQQASPSPSPSPSNRGKGRTARRSFDGVPSSSSPSLSPAHKGAQSLDPFRSLDDKGFRELLDAPEGTGMGTGDSDGDSDGEEDLSLSGLLRNKPEVDGKPSARTHTHAHTRRGKVAPARARQVSFTGKGGEVLPGAAVGYSPAHRHSSSMRRHSTGGAPGASGGPGSRLASVETAFEQRMETIGLHLVEVGADGNCLFRALAHQCFCDESQHTALRERCVRHLVQHRDRFEIFCTHDFDAYTARMAVDATWAGELEIRAMEEVLDRVILIYSSEGREARPVPLNTNFDEALIVGLHVEPIKLSYHAGCHYNSVFDQKCRFPLPLRNTHTLRDARIRLIRGGQAQAQAQAQAEAEGQGQVQGQD